jgi:uncharacterized protein (UPF0333 family)
MLTEKERSIMGEPGNANNSGQKVKGGMKFAVVAIVVVIAVLIAVIGVLASKLSQNSHEEPKEKKSVITADNAEEVIEEWINEDEGKQAPQYFTVTQNTEWSFPDGSSNSTDAFVENDKSNETAVYFEVLVDSIGEVVYSSPVLELGARIDDIKLDKVLDKGDYECTIIYHLVDDEQNELTTVNVGTTIHILE